MNYQGKATDKAGAPLNGNYNLTFRVYSTSTGGAAKWTEAQTVVQITNGVFSVQLGSVTPLNLAFDEDYWVSLEINTDGEMTPRTKLASVPYAYRAESFAEAPVIPFYRKGFDIECIDFNSVKISAGVLDVSGKMFATTAYSNPVLLEYVDSPKSRDWVHGSKTPNSTAYVYAYNNNGQIAFKFSDEAPNVSDQYGNTAQKPFLYRRYPDTSEGIGYRYIGQIPLDNTGNLIAALVVSSDVTPIEHGIQVFTYSGIFKKPAGVSHVFVEVVGGGGGGGGSGGGTSSFGDFCSATGGSSAPNIYGGVGGIGIDGDINIRGGTGGSSWCSPGGGIKPMGGNTVYGFGGCLDYGVHGTGYGGGGGGSNNSSGGGGAGGYAAKLCTLTGDVPVTVGEGGKAFPGTGNGAPGVVIVRW
jgi:hypothetical protein